MNIRFITVGKTTDSYLKTGIEEYAKRATRYVNFNIEEVVIKSQAEGQKLLLKEAEKILSIIQSTEYLILLDEKGEQLTSVDFATKIKVLQRNNISKIAFVCGGAYGFHQLVYDRANQQIALSKLTFTHQMVRLFFCEQLYRAFTIINNEKYHH